MAASTSLTVIFVDSNVSNYQWLIDNRKPDAEVVVLDAACDGITQITKYLAGQQRVSSAQIISHGAAGALQLGSTTLSAENLGAYAAQIRSWSKALTEKADILLMGCNVAADERGKAFVQSMARLTGADLAASTNLTGDATQGGDWVLEYTTGAIESTIAIRPQGLAQYNSVLAAFGSGNLVILRVGDGVNYGSSMAPVFLDEYTTTGQLVQTITIPRVDDSATGNQGLTLPATRFGTGMLNLSADGQYLTFGGWDQPVGASAGNSSWVIGVVNGGGIVDTTTLIPTNAVTPLGDLTTVASPDGVQFWMGTTNANGPAGGIRYGTYGSQTTTDVVQSINIRSLDIFNGQLYASSNQAGFRPVEVIGTGLPTTATTYQALPGLQALQNVGGLLNPQEFVFLDLNAGVAGVDTLYVTTLNGISKFSFNGTNWSYRNSFNSPSGNNWLGLTVSTSAGGVDLYAVQTNNQLVRVTDTAAFNANFAPSNAQSLVISAANTSFRGLAFTPSLPSVSVQVLDATALETGVANTASLRVERTSIAGTMTVQLALSGTAGANDYTVSGGAIANGILTVTILPGQTSVDVVLTANADREVEGNETFTVTLNPRDTYRITPGANTGTLTIIDNRLPNGVPDSYTVAEDGTLIVNALNGVLANDIDLDGNSLTVSRLLSDVNSGRLVLNADGSFTYTPNADFSGGDQFTYEVTDRYGEVGPVTVTLNVTPQSDVPVAVADQYSVNEDGVLTVAATAGVLANDSDADGNPLTAVLTDDVDNGTLTLNEDGSFTYTPNANYNGTDSFSYRVNDGTGLTSNIVTVQLRVNPAPDAPVAVADQYSVNEDGVLTVAATAGVLANDSDADGNPLSVVLTDDVDNGTLTLNEDGSFTYTPNANYNGTDSFSYRVNDGTGLTSNIVMVQLRVNPAPDAPVAVADQYSVNEDGVLTVDVAAGVLANDSDADGNPLTAVLTDDVDNGTLTLNEDGSFTYTPNANYNGTDSFSYRVNDGTGLTSNIVTVQLRVNPAPDAPVAVADQYSVNEDGVLTVDVAAGVLANDSDADGNPLTAVLTDDVDNGTLTLNEDGSFTYTPNADYNGTDSFSYRVNDGTGLTSNIVTVQLRVEPVGDVPLALPDQYRLDEDTVLTVTAPNGILSNDRDADGDTITVQLVDTVTSGVLNLSSDGSFTYTPDANFNGVDQFTYQATDGSGQSNVVTVELLVGDVSETPVGVADRYTVVAGSLLQVNAATGVLSNDQDVENDPLTAKVVTGPAYGTLTLNANGSFNYLSNNGFQGVDQFTYQANDGTSSSQPTTVTIDVTPANTVPQVRQPIADQVAWEDRAYVFRIPTNAFVDPDGDRLTYTARLNNGSALPQWLRFNGTTGQFSGTPGNANIGTLQVRVFASDPSGETTSDVFQLRVNNTNDAPRLSRSPSNFSALVGRRFSLRLPGNTFVDEDQGDRLSYQARLSNGRALPAWLRFDPRNLSFQGLPPAASEGVYSVRLIARDRLGAPALSTFTLRVRANNATVAMPNPTNIIIGTELNDSDIVRGTEAGDRIDALGRHDYIRGFGGDDVLLGRAGNDVLDGGVGNDWLVGGAGNDTHYGNTGRDVFVLAPGEGTDLIADFEKGSDRIGLSGGISFANLQIVQGSGATELRLNNAVLARLNGIQANTLTSSDFISVQVS